MFTARTLWCSHCWGIGGRRVSDAEPAGVAIELARHGCILTGVDAGAESPPAPAV